MTQTTAVKPGPVKQKAAKHSLAASTAGQILEWYEWSAYAVFAPVIAAVLFNPDDPISSLLSTLAVFAVGFLMRPLGGVVFGYIADKRGRRFVLITTMLTMAAGSVAIGFIPTYDSIGIWASVLLLVIRLVQGFAHGGESAAANSYVAEIAPNHRRGLWGSLVYMAIFAGSILAYTLGSGITWNADASFIADIGWRIPFWLGAILALVVLWMRRGMAESATFDSEASESTENQAEETRRSAPEPVPFSSAQKKQQTKNILLIIALVAGLTAAHYTWTSYISTYAIVEQGMDQNSAYVATVGAQLVTLIALPLWGLLSDRIGRKPVLFFFAIMMSVLQFPLMGMINDQPWTLLVATMVALIIVSALGAITAAIMAEIFPTAQRTRNIGIAYSLSVGLFGGFAPYINQAAYSMDMGWLASAYIILLCIVTLVAGTRLKETKGIDLQSVK